MGDSIVPNPPLLGQIQSLDAAELLAVRQALFGSLLEQPPNSLTPGDAIQWKDQAGALREYIEGMWSGSSGSSGLHQIIMGAGSPLGLVGAGAALNAFVTGVPGSVGNASVGAGAQDGTGNSNGARIIDALGSSSFPQLPGNVPSRQLLGDFAACYCPGATSFAWGPGKGEPIAVGGQSTLYDPQSRLDGSGRYITHSPGLFLAFGVDTLTLSTGTAVTTSVRNNSTGYELGVEDVAPANFEQSFPICVPIVATAAGQSISMWNQVNNAATQKATDTQSGIATLWFACGQIA